MQSSILQDEFSVIVWPEVCERRLSGAQVWELEKMFYAGAEFVLKALTEKPSEQGLIYDEISRHLKRVEDELAQPIFKVRHNRDD
jgi:hypothetical protein